MNYAVTLALSFSGLCGAYALYSGIRLRRSLRRLNRIIRVFSYDARGVHKRLEELREISVALQDGCPELLSSQPWVLGWVESQIYWLESLADQLGAEISEINVHNRYHQHRYRRKPPSV